MGLDVSKFVQELVTKVENRLGDRATKNNRIDQANAAEYSLFMAEMGQKVRTEEIGKDDFNEILGLALSGKNNETAGTRGGVNINITINIDIDVVVKACGGGGCDDCKEEALQQLVDMFIAEMTREGGSVQNFIIGLIKAFAGTTQVDLSSIEQLLADIMKKLDEQGQKIDDLQNTVNDLKTYIKQELDNLYFSLKSEFKDLGIDISGLADLIKSDDEEILKKLSTIHAAIMELTNKFNSFTQVEQQRFEELMAAIGSLEIGGGDGSAVLAKLELMHTLLLEIKNDTSETKDNSKTLIDNSKKIIQLIEEGNQAVITAIQNINIIGGSYDDTKVREMLTEILAKLTNVATKEDLEALLQKFNASLNNIKVALEKATDDAKTEILNAISAINVEINLPDGYDDTGLKNLLTQILNNMVTKDDLSAQMKKFQEMVATLEANLTKVSNDNKKEILDAINKISVNVNIPDEYKQLLLQIINDMVTKGDLDTLLAKFKVMLDNLQIALEKASDEDKVEIINAINAININITLPDGYDDTGLKNLLTQILNNMVTKDDLSAQMQKFQEMVATLEANLTKVSNENKKEILDAINNISVDVNIPDEYKQLLLQIINDMVTKGDFEELKKIIANAQQAIEFAIKTSETNIIEHINKVAQNININPEGPDLDGVIALLNSIVAKLDDNAKANAQYYTAVMEAIANIKTGEPVDLSEVLKLLNSIKALAEANGGKLDNVLNNQATIKLVLDGIVDGLNTLTDKSDAIKAVVDEILAIVKNLHNCECDCVDEATLRIILCEFVTQINSQPHEGVQGDILGTRAGTRADANFEAACKNFVVELNKLGLHSAIDGTTGISTPKSTAKPGVYYDLGGRELGTEKPSRPGVYIIDGKKVLVK